MRRRPLPHHALEEIGGDRAVSNGQNPRLPCSAPPRKITQPTLVIHGAHDNLCPIEDAHQLFEHIASKEKAWFAAEHADHFHILESSDRPEINRQIVEFFRIGKARHDWANEPR
jgi:pimeloyl-ACP methyl ester carboxylesterase